MVGNFWCSRRPAGSERPGLKLGRLQPLFHFPSLGCYVTSWRQGEALKHGLCGDRIRWGDNRAECEAGSPGKR